MIKRMMGVLLGSGEIRADGVNLRLWFWFYVGFMVLLAGTALVSFGVYAGGGESLAMRVWLLSLYLFYMSLCCTFFPAPTAWLVLFMASPMFGLVRASYLEATAGLSVGGAKVLAAVLTILVVGGLGAFGTAVANLNEYHVFTFLLRFGRVNKVRGAKFYQAASRWFSVSPFSLMAVISFLPVPVDVVRWLAISNRYRRDYFFWASFVGRFLRYGLLAGAAFYLEIGPVGIIVIQLVMIGVVALRYLPRLVNGGKAEVIEVDGKQ